MVFVLKVSSFQRASRPPYVCVWDLFCAINDIDLYVMWANLFYGKVSKTIRRFAGGMLAIRPNKDGLSHWRHGEDIKRRLVKISFKCIFLSKNTN